MIGNLGYGEMILVGFLVLLLFGAKRLPEIGSSLGKSIKMFKKSIKDIQEELPTENDFEEERPRPRPKSQPYQDDSPSQEAPKENTQD